MATIYELDEQQRDILDRLFFLDENDEDDVEEIQRLNRDLAQLTGSAERKLEFLSKILLESRAILAEREEAKRRAERRRKIAENSVGRLTEVCERIMLMFDIRKISLSECDLSLQKGPPGLHYDENFDSSALPDNCVEVILKPLAKEIKEYMKDGMSFKGIELIQKESLRIR